MKKKNNKNTIPAYAFGMDQLSNYLGGANVFGSAISGLSEEGSTGDIAGSTIGSAASLAGAGLTVGGPIGAAVGGGLGLVSGLIGSIKRKKQMQALRRRKETLNKTKIGMNAAAETEGEYWDDNDLAYTFENGGILPDLAYLDNNEVVRDDYGNIVQVPNTKPGTDNHLVDASTLESVLSDKIKRPGTKNTFAKEGQILSKMTKPSKGKDKFAENTNRLNKINANKAYNKLLAEQEAVKAANGVKPKVKGIPAYEDGTNSGYSPDWLSLAPTVYNTLQSLRGPEEEPLVLNPYAGAVRSTMARRRMNIEPARLANSRSRAISNYNLANINANTGANLAARTQAAVDEYASNANMYATKQNADNAYLGEYANTLNNLGQQFVQSENMYNDLNARNRAAARNFGATATSQLGKWSQVNRQMQNQYNRDQMTLPFLADFLSQGFTKEQVYNLLTRTRNRV